jgi:hypothetical protein
MKLLFALILVNITAIFAQAQTFKSNYSNNYLFKTELSNKYDYLKPHSIRKAVVLSAVLPGAGQIYNHIHMPKGKKKAFWKVPLIYTGLGGSTYFLVKNQATQRSLKKEYTLRQAGEPGNIQWSEYTNDQDILTLYNQYLDWRDLSIIAIGIAYLFQLADAGVEAHFVSFDVSEDLSMAFKPVILNDRTPGLKLSLNFR